MSDDFTIPPRKYSTMPPTVSPPIGDGLKPGRFRAYCRTHAPEVSQEQAWSYAPIDIDDQRALFADHFAKLHPERPRCVAVRIKKNAPWKAPSQNAWEPKERDPGAEIVVGEYGDCQVWSGGPVAGSVWVIPRARNYPRALLVSRDGRVLETYPEEA
jgi:hypothetical protein